MIRFTEKQREEFIKNNYITCKYCGYNNKRNRFDNFGTCLCCGKILDKRTYFIARLMKETNKEAVLQNNGRVI
jgi:ribosomal protein L37AE/L43A